MNKEYPEFNTCINIKVDWSELNLFGHVSNVEFFKYIQSSRINYLDTVGLSNSLMNGSISTILASASCEFKKPLFYPGQIKILAKVDFIKNTSFGMTHLILNEMNEVAGIGKDVIVLYDYTIHQKISITNAIRNSIQEQEQTTF